MTNTEVAMIHSMMVSARRTVAPVTAPSPRAKEWRKIRRLVRLAKRIAGKR